ncbi:MAG: hypothetical protein MZW92_64015 [Comamonadaceae bacterium]|nr:hypothetical protein [Comamonadaceae bacterium]
MKSWIEKQKYLIDFTLSSLARRKVKNLGLLAGLYPDHLPAGLGDAVHPRPAARGGGGAAGLPEVILQRMVAGRHDLIPPGYLEKIGRIRGVQKMEGRLWGYYYDSVVKANYTFMAPSAERDRDGQRS